MTDITIPNLEERPLPIDPDLTYLGVSDPLDGQTYKINLRSWAASLRNVVLRQTEYIVGSGEVLYIDPDRIEFQDHATWDNVLEIGTYIKVLLDPSGEQIEKIIKYISPGIYQVERPGPWLSSRDPGFEYKLPRLVTANLDGSLRDQWGDDLIRIGAHTIVGKSSFGEDTSIVSAEGDIICESSLNVKEVAASGSPSYIESILSTDETVILGYLKSDSDMAFESDRVDFSSGFSKVKTDAVFRGSGTGRLGIAFNIDSDTASPDTVIGAQTIEYLPALVEDNIIFERDLYIPGPYYSSTAESIKQGFVVSTVKSESYNSVSGTNPDWIKFQAPHTTYQTSLTMPNNALVRFACWTGGCYSCYQDSFPYLDQGGPWKRQYALKTENLAFQKTQVFDSVSDFSRGASIDVIYLAGSDNKIPQEFLLKSKGVYKISIAINYGTNEHLRSGSPLVIGFSKDPNLTWNSSTEDKSMVLAQNKFNWHDTGYSSGMISCTAVLVLTHQAIRVVPFLALRSNANNPIFHPGTQYLEITKIF